MKIRYANLNDLENLVAVEAECFPEAEAAGRSSIKSRLEVFPNHFWVIEEEDKIVSFINGMVSDEMSIRDEMFEDASLHNEDGAWQMIFGVDTLPEYRCRGLAGMLMKHIITECQNAGRKGMVLTCKDHMLSYYEKFGFVNCGVSKSVHGGALWYDMILKF